MSTHSNYAKSARKKVSAFLIDKDDFIVHKIIGVDTDTGIIEIEGKYYVFNEVMKGDELDGSHRVRFVEAKLQKAEPLKIG